MRKFTWCLGCFLLAAHGLQANTASAQHSDGLVEKMSYDSHSEMQSSWEWISKKSAKNQNLSETAWQNDMETTFPSPENTTIKEKATQIIKEKRKKLDVLDSLLYENENKYYYDTDHAKKRSPQPKDIDFTKTNFQGIINKSNYEEANLQNANFQGATITQTNFEKAQLQGANFQGVRLIQNRFYGADLRGAVFQKADLEATNFEKAQLQGVNFQGVKLIETRFYEADLRGVNFQGAIVLEGNFRLANLHQTNFQGADIRFVLFEHANINEVNFQETNIYKTNFQRANNIPYANFSGAKYIEWACFGENKEEDLAIKRQIAKESGLSIDETELNKFYLYKKWY